MDLIYDNFIGVLNRYWPRGEKPKIVAAKYADATVGNIVKITLDTVQIQFPTIYPTPKLIKTQLIINGQFDTQSHSDSFLINLINAIDGYLLDYEAPQFFQKLIPISVLTLPNLPTGAVCEAVVSAEAMI